MLQLFLALLCSGPMMSAIASLQDGNGGLVKLVIEGQARRQIQKLTQTYLTLRSLAHWHELLGLMHCSFALSLHSLWTSSPQRMPCNAMPLRP